MKQLLITSILGVLAFSSPVFSAEETKPAQSAPADPSQMIQQRLEMMKQALNLSTEQVDKLKPLMERDGEKIRAIMADANLSQEDRRTKVREVMQSSGESINAILTPEQKDKWKELAAKRRAEAQKRQAGGGANQ